MRYSLNKIKNQKPKQAIAIAAAAAAATRTMKKTRKEEYEACSNNLDYAFKICTDTTTRFHLFNLIFKLWVENS